MLVKVACDTPFTYTVEVDTPSCTRAICDHLLIGTIDVGEETVLLAEERVKMLPDVPDDRSSIRRKEEAAGPQETSVEMVDVCHPYSARTSASVSARLK